MPGFQASDPDAFQRQMVEAIAHFIEPPFEIRYRQEPYPETETIVGVVSVPVSQRRPHVVRNDGEGIYRGQIFVRRGTQIVLASRQEVIEMCGDHWQPFLREHQRSLEEYYHELDRDVTDFRRIAESVCRRLYHTLPRKTRGRVVKKILTDLGRGDLFREWFEEK